MPSFLVAALLAAHGLIHASFISPAPPPKPGSPEWPFDLAHSRVLGPLGLGTGGTRTVGLVLLTVVVVGYVAAAASVLGVAPASLFPPATIVASVASIALLALFFHRWLVLGIVIDVALLWLVLANGWTPVAG